MKMDIQIGDARGSTPLHFACFKSSEIALIYLLAWIKNAEDFNQ